MKGTAFFLSVMFILFNGCATPEVMPVKGALSGEFDGAPDWVVKNCRTYFEDEKPLICGVGSVGGTRNPSLARTTAQARGRDEIARSLETKIRAMMKDYQANTTGGEDYGTAAADEQHVIDVSKQITQETLRGTRMEETWLSTNGTMYTLMVLDTKAFKGALASMNQLDEGVRKAVIERADKAFLELDKETVAKEGQ